MCEQVILENPGMLQFIPNNCKTQEISEKAVDYHPFESARDCFKTQEMCNKTVNFDSFKKGKKQPQIKLQRLRKVSIWTFE